MAYTLGLGYIYNVYMLLLFRVLLRIRIYILVLNIQALRSAVFLQSLGTIIIMILLKLSVGNGI